MVTSVHCATYVLYVCCLCFFIHKVRRHCGPLCRLRSLNGPEGCREDREVAICLVVPASSPGLLESWNLACNPGCEASGSRSASKPISKQQLLQGDERISRRPGMTNDSHADSSFFFFLLLSWLFFLLLLAVDCSILISVFQAQTQTGLQCGQVAGGRQIL